MLANAAVRNKSPEAFRTISEVATELDVPQHVLRFWEGRFAQIKPVKRAGGRRYYRPEDVDLLRGIRTLLYREGFTIKGVQKILKERGHRHVIELGRGETAPIIPTAPMRPKPVRERTEDEDLFARPTNVISMERAPEPASELQSEWPVVAEDFIAIDEAPADGPGIEAEIEDAAETAEVEASMEYPDLSQDKRERLEILLGQLLQLKARLREG